jgi:hypothetical protein
MNVVNAFRITRLSHLPPARPPALPLILKSKTFAEQNDPATE